MHFRRSAAVVVAAAALFSAGCAELDDRGRQQTVNAAVFDPNASLIPLPNDLAFQSEAIAAAAAAGACETIPADGRTQLVCGFARNGGFPFDQEVPITFAFARQRFDSGAVTTDPVAVDTTTVRPLGVANPSLAVFDVTGTPAPVAVQTSFDAATGVLTIRKAQVGGNPATRRWVSGHRYAAFVRGGPNGVRTADGGVIEPSPTMMILRNAIIANRDLSKPDNQTLIPGTFEEKMVAGAKLERIRASYAPLRALYEGAGLGSFADLVNLATFRIAPGVAIELDAAKGSVPLPIDLLRAPDALGGRIVNNPAFGDAAVGLATLDGFSTTGAITAPLAGIPAGLDPSTPASVDASTVNGANVFLFELGAGGAAPTLLPELGHELTRTGGNPASARWTAMPPKSYASSGHGCGIAGGCAHRLYLIAGVAMAKDASGPYAIPPLKGGTKYAVVVTNRVKDTGGRGLRRNTPGQLLLDVGVPLTSALTGGDAALAALLQQMKNDLAPIWSNLPAGTTKADVAMAWVFKTQSVPDVSLQLSAAPYGIEQGRGSPVFVPAAVTSVTSSYPQVAGAAAVYEVVFPSVDVTSKTNGALDPAVLGSTTLILANVRPLKALVAIPDPSLVPSNCPAPAAALKCAPLVVYGHGLRGSKSNMLTSAGAPTVNSLLARGFVVAATDFPQHGERTWCLASSDCDVASVGAGDGVCTKFTTGGAPSLMGDFDPSGVPTAPGVCTAGKPNPARSGQTFISQNFFRTRDTFRQNLLDQSALVLAFARPPSAQWPVQPAPGADPFATAAAALGVAVNPGAVYWEGISLGGIAGTEVLATNPRFSRGVTSVTGGTLVDFFTQSPAFHGDVKNLFSSLLKPQLDAIAPGTRFDDPLVDPDVVGSYDRGVADRLEKTLQLAKWILDAGDPLNYAKHLRAAPLPNLLASSNGSVLQTPKSVLGQVAIGDPVIPSAFQRALYANGGIDVVEYTSLTYTVPQMHGIIGFDPTVQAQAASYLSNLTRPPAPPTQVTIP